MLSSKPTAVVTGAEVGDSIRKRQRKDPKSEVPMRDTVFTGATRASPCSLTGAAYELTPAAKKIGLKTGRRTARDHSLAGAAVVVAISTTG